MAIMDERSIDTVRDYPARTEGGREKRKRDRDTRNIDPHLASIVSMTKDIKKLICP